MGLLLPVPAALRALFIITEPVPLERCSGDQMEMPGCTSLASEQRPNQLHPAIRLRFGSYRDFSDGFSRQLGE
jgi:hypothetical protein